MRQDFEQHLFGGNLLAAVDVETTGLDPDRDSIVQFAVQLVSRKFELLGSFSVSIVPLRDGDGLRVCKYDSRGAVSLARAESLFYNWLETLGLPIGRGLVPIAHNWPFDFSFLCRWLGRFSVSEIFRGPVKDTYVLAGAINDYAILTGRPPIFEKLSLVAVASHFGLRFPPHDALEDSRAAVVIYPKLLALFEELASGQP